MRFAFLFKFFLIVSFAQYVQAEELPVIGQAAITTPSRSEQERDLGLEMLWLPLESRTSLTDFLGRNLPGAALNADGALLLRGGRAQDTAFELDGLRVRRLRLPLGMVERFDLATAGYGADWSDVMGGVVGVATKPGGNRWHVDAETFAQAHGKVETAELSSTVSLPLVRDRLFLIVSLRAESTRTPDVTDVERIISSQPGPTDSKAGGGIKLTWVPRPDHVVESLTLLDLGRQDYSSGLGFEPDAQPSHRQRELLTSLRWSGRFHETVTAHAQIGLESFRAEERPLLCDSEPDQCDLIAPRVQKFPRRIQSDNWVRHSIERDTGWQAAAGAEARLHEGPRVRQRLRLSSRWWLQRLAWRSSVPGDRYFEDNQGPEALTTYYANDPRTEPARFGWFSVGNSYWTGAQALESETRLFDRLWIVPGLGLTASGVRADNFTFRTAVVTPHVGLTWNPDAEGRSWLHASVHQRSRADLEDLARFAHPYAVAQRCSWDAATMRYSKGCVWSGGGNQQTVGLPCGPVGLDAAGAPCSSSLAEPRSWEYVLGGSHLLGLGIRAGLDVVYRRASGLPRIQETNRIWNATDDTTIGFRNGRDLSVLDYSDRGPPSRYLGATAWLRREAAPFRFMLAYTRSNHDGDTFEGNPSFGVPVRGALEGPAIDDRRHVIRALASYDAGGYASLGLAYSFQTGIPLHVFDVGELYRTPHEQRFNLQLRLRARRLIRADLDVYLDLLDFLADRQIVIPASSDRSLTLDSIKEGRWARLGLEYRY